MRTAAAPAGSDSEGEPMSISVEGLRKIFEEQVDRPLQPGIDEASAGLAGLLIHGLSSVPPELVADVEPSLAFEAGYRDTAGKGGER
jgi:hypothetical protein